MKLLLAMLFVGCFTLTWMLIVGSSKANKKEEEMETYRHVKKKEDERQND